jgi:hypothetical protein
MACVNRIKPLIIVVMAVVLAAGSLHADPLQRLKNEVASLERDLTRAQRTEREASQALERNHAAQRRASGDELARLKTEATRLAANESRAAEETQKARRDLSAKQGELRSAASRHTVAQLSGRGDLAERMTAARAAAEAWQSNLGELPPVPAVRDLSDIIDPAERAAIRAGDRNRLRTYESWAGAEITRINAELQRVEQIINAEDDIKGDRNGAQLVRTANAIKSTLEARKRRVESDRRTAQRRIRDLG